MSDKAKRSADIYKALFVNGGTQSLWIAKRYASLDSLVNNGQLTCEPSEIGGFVYRKSDHTVS